MSEKLVELSIGARPWKPSDEADQIAEFDRYNFPTCGLIVQHGEHFVFECFEGHVMEVSVWVYAHVTAEEAGDLQTLAGDDLIDALERILESRSLMGALAIDGRLRSGTVVHQKDIEAKGLGRALFDELQAGRQGAEKAAEALLPLACA